MSIWKSKDEKYAKRAFRNYILNREYLIDEEDERDDDNSGSDDRDDDGGQADDFGEWPDIEVES